MFRGSLATAQVKTACRSPPPSDWAARSWLVCPHYRQFGDLGRRIKWTRTAFQMHFKLITPLINNRHRRNGCGVTQRAESAAKHVLRQILDVVDVLAQAAAVVEARKRLLEPVCTLTAGNTPTAAFMLVELHHA